MIHLPQNKGAAGNRVFHVAAQQCPGATRGSTQLHTRSGCFLESGEGKKKKTPLRELDDPCAKTQLNGSVLPFFAHSSAFSPIRAKPPIRAFSPLFDNARLNRADSLPTQHTTAVPGYSLSLIHI